MDDKIPQNPQEKRRHERYPVYCPLEYKAEDTHPKEPCVTLNISEGGALISVKRGLPLASNLIMKLKLKDETFFIISKVKHVRQGGESDAYEVGVEFWDKPRVFSEKFYDEINGIKDYQKNYKAEHGDDISLAEASVNWYKNTSY